MLTAVVSGVSSEHGGAPLPANELAMVIILIFTRINKE